MKGVTTLQLYAYTMCHRLSFESFCDTRAKLLLLDMCEWGFRSRLFIQTPLRKCAEEKGFLSLSTCYITKMMEGKGYISIHTYPVTHM